MSSLASFPEGKILSPHKRENLTGKSAEQPSQFPWNQALKRGQNGAGGGGGGGRQMGQKLELKYFKCHL